jgi:hypothetical protein
MIMQASNTPEAEENDGHGAVTASVSKKKKKRGVGGRGIVGRSSYSSS